MDQDEDRHFAGSIYGIAVFETTITTADAWCMFAEIAPPTVTGESVAADDDNRIEVMGRCAQVFGFRCGEFDGSHGTIIGDLRCQNA